MSGRTLNRLQAFFNGDDAAPLTLTEGRDHLRLRTLVLLRWLAILGQTGMVLLIAYVFGFQIRLWTCLAIIMASAWLNLVLTINRRNAHRMHGWEAAIQLSFDALQLTALLGVTGGLNNPFCLMLVAPATVAAANLPTRFALPVIGVAIASAFGLAFWSLELPWLPGESFALPDIYRYGFLSAIIVGIVFTAGYAWQAALESTKMEQALSATQAVLEKEHRLSALGSLAAAAAHELGTPLGTIQVVAKEMLRSLKKTDPLYEDAQLLVSQSQRCRDILKSLSTKPEQRDSVYDEIPLRTFLEAAAAPYAASGRKFEISVTSEDGDAEAFRIRRRPEWLHAVSAFVENSTDFARTTVFLTFDVTRSFVSLMIEDDGAGFSPDILSRLGEPYISSRVYGEDDELPAGKAAGQSHSGMGLGFFIAKTLCEHTGATVTFGNREEGGAYVRALWRREPTDILSVDA